VEIPDNVVKKRHHESPRKALKSNYMLNVELYFKDAAFREKDGWRTIQSNHGVYRFFCGS
jgi:hypothetical protein